MKLWGGRFTKATDKNVEAFNASIQFDCRMYAEDICGSIAHATMLARQGIHLKVEDIPMDDPAVYQMISRGDTDGVFQLVADVIASTSGKAKMAEGN